MKQELFDRVYETVVKRESTFDGIYYTGVKTTRIVCRPSCRARTPKPENVIFYLSIDDAVRAGFRPCKRCRPETAGALGPDAALAVEVDRLAAQRLDEPLTLSMIAARLAVSPFHLQRTYKRVTGQSPADKRQQVRLDAARAMLREQTATVAQVGAAVGFRSPSHFAEWFRRATGEAPSAYRDRFQGGLS